MKAVKYYQRFLLVFITLSLFIFQVDVKCQTRVRKEIKIPNILGYEVLKCDFHMHTVFSDGTVWPTIRPEEAWREGLDAIAITEHVEKHRYGDDVRTDLNRSYEIAKPVADQLDLIIIKAGEITRMMPPGHMNAIFLKDVSLLKKENYKGAIKAAIDQGAFVFWNHPGWTGQQPDGISRWYPEHTELYENGWIHGIEVVNEREYYPRAQKWCMEKKLTMVGNSDIHSPINLEYNFYKGEHRPMTIVFAKEKSADAIKEALFARRTVVFSNNTLIGEEKYLRSIFNASINIGKTDFEVKGRNRFFIKISNKSDIDFELETDYISGDILVPKNVTLYADNVVMVEFRAKLNDISGKKNIRIPYKVRNLLIAPEEGLLVELYINATFIPAE